jgi:hypothetical protein
MTAEIAVLQAEADALHQTILDAVRGLIERQPDLCVHIEANFYRDDSPNELTGTWFEIGSTVGPIVARLNVNVGVTGR